MCGITGYFSQHNDFSPNLFSAANNIVKHRGPDDFGYITINEDLSIDTWQDENLKDFNEKQVYGAMGFRRLSIIDLSPSGHQPMADATGNYRIIFNGEIYNYVELRLELLKKGYTFGSNSDTEVILNAYREWGRDCLNKFNGMWAFCLLDRSNKKLFCARDRFGIKPFYYFLENGTFAFASEIKQILELFPGRIYNINSRIAFDFLAAASYGNETRETFFSNIYKLMPGSYIELDLNRDAVWEKREKKWWDLPAIDHEANFNEDFVFETIQNLLEDSTKVRLRSDMPIGTALSGGLDSSGIVAMVNKLYGGDAEKNKVFTITSEDKTIDDTYFAQIIINNIPVKSYLRGFEEHADIHDLEKFIWHQEEPLQNASIFGSWQLYKFIKEMGVTVALDGQGADELMGGYNRYPFRRYLLDVISNYGIKEYLKQTNLIAKVYRKSKSDVYYNTFLAQLVEFSKKIPGWYYSEKLGYTKAWLNRDFYNENFKDSHLINKSFYDEKKRFHSHLKRESYELLKYTNLTGILRQVDRNSMAFSVEARLPFLDYRLAEFLYSLPVHFMIRDGYTKFAYRMAMKDLIPKEVLWRKTKVGFKMPEYEILKSNRKFIVDQINSLPDNEYVNREQSIKMLDSILIDKNHYNSIIWRIVCFALWKNKFRLN
jgi:asparagine synthase (glutamine-hydrolysing)